MFNNKRAWKELFQERGSKKSGIDVFGQIIAIFSHVNSLGRSARWLAGRFIRHAMRNHGENLSKLHHCPCPPVSDLCCREYGLVSYRKEGNKLRHGDTADVIVTSGIKQCKFHVVMFVLS